MLEIGSSPLNFANVDDVIFHRQRVKLSEPQHNKIAKIYQSVLRHASDERPIYGLNTGFGALAEKRISAEDQGSLQHNIILSHAVGIGEPLDIHCARTMLLLRINTLAQGYSGASPALLDHLVKLLNADCTPLIPKKGSVGASGDLAPLAHLGLMLLGLGDAFVDGKLTTAKKALEHAGLSPLKLGLRDGLALINGTQAMTATAINALKKCADLAMLADLMAAASLDALGGHATPFDDRLHNVKPHPGQIKSAALIRKAIKGRSSSATANNARTQDPYSLRCAPQVHGATRDAIAHVSDVVVRELNAVTDNPLIFIDGDSDHLDIVSGGNFHGQHLALTLDYLAMAIAELANISERRLELLLNPVHSNGLPPFLIENSGLNSGYMMLHVTASALVNENKVLSHPASTDSIPTSANREDHVSMGMTSANKLCQIIENTTAVLAIECLESQQALDLRPKNSAGDGVRKFHEAIRKEIPYRSQDVLFKDDLAKALAWLADGKTKAVIHEIFS